MSVHKFKSLITLPAFAFLATPLMVSSIASAAEYELEIGAVESPDGSNTRGWYAFEQYVEARTDEIEINIRPSGQIGSTVELLEDVKLGTHKMAQGDSSITSAYAPMKAWFIPYLFNDMSEMKQFFESDTFQGINEQMAEEFGVRALAATPYGFYNIMNKKRAVTRIEDVAGLKLRTLPNSTATIETWDAIGASATPVSWSEIYTSIKTGVIDGVAHTMGIIQDQRYYEVANHVTRDKSFGVANLYIVNEDFYQGLPDDLQKVLKNGAQLGADVEYGTAVFRNNVEAVEVLQENNIDIVNLAPEDRERFKQAAQDVMIPWAKEQAGAENVEAVLSEVEAIQSSN